MKKHNAPAIAVHNAPTTAAEDRRLTQHVWDSSGYNGYVGQVVIPRIMGSSRMQEAQLWDFVAMSMYQYNSNKINDLIRSDKRLSAFDRQMMAFGAIAENNPDLLLYVIAKNYLQCTSSTSYCKDTASVLFNTFYGHALHWAGLQKPSERRDAVIALMLRYVDPNVVSKILREPLLHTAISKADFSLIEMLLKHPKINLQLTDYRGHSVDAHITTQVDVLNAQCDRFREMVECSRAVMTTHRPGFLEGLHRCRVAEYTQKIADSQSAIARFIELSPRLSFSADESAKSTASEPASARNAP